jgi:hypothetical protein
MSISRLQFLLAGLFLAASAVPPTTLAGITAIARTGSSTNCLPEAVAPFEDGSIAFCDQPYTWTAFPPEAEGLIIDYVKVSDADAAVGDYGLEVTVDRRGSMLLLIHPGIDVPVDMPWVVSGGWVKEGGINWTLDQGGPGVVYDLWAVDVTDTGAPVVLGPQNNGVVSNYGVAFVTDAGDLEITLKDDPDPYILNSGVDWTRTWQVQNSGSSAMDEIVVRIGATGIDDSTFVNLETSPNSSFNEQGMFRWRIATLESGESATLSVTRIFGPAQSVGTGIIETTGVIESFDGFDPDLDNNSVAERSSVLDFSPAITSVSRLGSSANCEPTLGGTLFEGAEVYCDEPFFMSSLPPEVDGEPIEYIVTANSDRSVADYGLSIEVSRRGSLLLFIDPTIVVASEMTWVVDDGFEKVEGITGTIDRNGDPVVFDLWARDVLDPSMTVTTGAQNLGGGSNYVVAYVGDMGDLALSIEATPNPYRAGSGDLFVRTYTLENLGPGINDDVVVGFSATGFTDATFVSLETSPNSTWNQFGQFKWRIPIMDAGDVATFTVTFTLGPDQELGSDIITVNANIESSDRFDPDTTNNTASLGITVQGDVVLSDGFELPDG